MYLCDSHRSLQLLMCEQASSAVGNPAPAKRTLTAALPGVKNRMSAAGADDRRVAGCLLSGVSRAAVRDAGRTVTVVTPKLTVGPCPVRIESIGSPPDFDGILSGAASDQLDATRHRASYRQVAVQQNLSAPTPLARTSKAASSIRALAGRCRRSPFRRYGHAAPSLHPREPDRAGGRLPGAGAVGVGVPRSTRTTPSTVPALSATPYCRREQWRRGP